MLEKLFKLKEHKTTVRVEIVAGIITFLTMSYILVVNPNILSATEWTARLCLRQPLLQQFWYIVYGFYT